METADTYPGDCTVSDEELRAVKSLLTSDEDLKTYVESWPPRDENDNVYSIWFTVDDLTDAGRLVDSNGNQYEPFSGNVEPSIATNKRCNAPLNNWRERYPQIRYCGHVANAEKNDTPYCHLHRNRVHTMKSAEEMMQTGYFTQSMDTLYEHLDPWKKLMGWGTFESLMGESKYAFAPEYEERTLDFSEAPIKPDEVDDGVLHVKFGYPTDHPQRALALYVAAMQNVQMVSVQPRIMFEGTRDDGTQEGMMESRTVEKAQLTAPPSEHDSTPQQFKTIETWSEHHLNLPLSRLVKDQPRLLEMGGVTTDPEESSDSVGSDDLVLELPVEAEPDGVESTSSVTDPNYFGDDGQAESEKIISKAGDGET